jgi:segregation and condensation protein B
MTIEETPASETPSPEDETVEVANQLPAGDDVAAASATAEEAENPESDVAKDDAEEDTEESRA